MRFSWLVFLVISCSLLTGCMELGSRLQGWLDWRREPYYHVNGRITVKNEKGDTISIRHWWQGRRHGVWKDFYADGTPREETRWNRGYREGPARTWFENGQLKTEGSYRNRKPDGPWREWHSNGTLASEIFFELGREVGLARTWDSEGKLLFEEKKSGVSL